MESNIKNVIYINSIEFDDITDKFDYAEYKNADSMLTVTHRYDGISEKHLQNSLHAHSYYEFELVYGGMGVQILKKTSFSMSRGCAYLRTPNNLHTTHQDENNKLKSYNIRFSVDFIPKDLAANLMAEDNALYVKFDENELGALIEKIKCLASEIKNSDFYSPSVLSAVFCEILVAFIRKYHLTAGRNANYSHHVQSIINYINSNYRKKLSVSELAGIFHLNPHYMGSLFIREAGRSISEYILELRLILSVQLLMSSSLSVSEIAFECGFNTPAYFIVKFRERYGAPPKKYMSLYSRQAPKS